MSNFRKQFKQGDDYCDIRADYRSLTSIGKSVEETEDLLLRAYCPKAVSYTHLLHFYKWLNG